MAITRTQRYTLTQAAILVYWAVHASEKLQTTNDRHGSSDIFLVLVVVINTVFGNFGF